MILKELFVKLGLDVDAQSFAKGQIAANAISRAFSFVANSIAENISQAIHYGDEIIKTSQRIGIATTALQELQYAGSLAGLSTDEMSTAVRFLSRNLQEAKTKGGEAAKAFRGIDITQGGKLRATDEILGDIADKFAGMEDGAEKTALAVQLFGRAGTRMIPLLNKGREELEKTRLEAEAFGLVMSEEDALAAEELNDNLERLHQIMRGFWRQILGPLIPDLNKLVKVFIQWRLENAKIISQKLHTAYEALKTALELVWKWGGAVFNILSGVYTVLEKVFGPTTTRVVLGFAAALWIAFSPIGAIVAGIALLVGVIDDLYHYFQGDKETLFGEFMEGIDKAFKEPGKHWWVAEELGRFVDFIKEATQEIKAFYELLKGPGIIGELRMGEWRKRKENAYLTNNPTAPSVLADRGMSSNGTVVNINVTQQPGQSGPALARDIWAEANQAQLQETGAGILAP